MTREKATLKWAALAKCADCMGHWIDGRVDCENRGCSLYSWMPYRRLDPDMEWAKYNPRRVGEVTWDEMMTEEERTRRAERLAKIRKVKVRKKSQGT